MDNRSIVREKERERRKLSMLAITAPVSPGCVPFEALFPSAAKEKKGNGTRKRWVLERGGTERTRGKKKKEAGDLNTIVGH